MTTTELQKTYNRLYRYIQADRMNTRPGTPAHKLADQAMADATTIKDALKAVLAITEAVETPMRQPALLDVVGRREEFA